MKIFLTGGSGTLGRALRALDPSIIAPTRQEMDLVDYRNVGRVLSKYMPDLIIHAAAFTNTVAAEEEQFGECYATNVVGTRNLVSQIACPIVFISTEYVFDGQEGNYQENAKRNALSYYAHTKIGGEDRVRKFPNSLIIRTLFKPRPFPHTHATTDQWTSGDYVDVIAPDILKASKWFAEGKIPVHILHIGTDRKTMFELAKRSNPTVQPIERADVKTINLPKDTSLDCSIWQAIK